MESGNQQLCTFFIGSNLLGIDIEHIRDVLKARDLTPVPAAPDVITGLLNLRGQIATVIDLRERIGFPPKEEGDAPLNIVIEKNQELYSLLVDEVGDMIDVQAETLEAAPETLEPKLKSVVSGVHKLDELLLVLDIDEILDI